MVRLEFEMNQKKSLQCGDATSLAEVAVSCGEVQIVAVRGN